MWFYQYVNRKYLEIHTNEFEEARILVLLVAFSKGNVPEIKFR